MKDLLTHTSGLVSGTFSNREAAKVGLKGKETLADYLPRLGGVPLEFQPGTRWAYSAQAGFDTLLRIVEIASGQPADQFLKQRLFDPLGMKDTYFYPAEGNPRLVTLYRKTATALEKQNIPNFMNGAYFSGGGGLMSTAEDYLQFAQMLLNGGQLNGRRLLAPRTVEVMRSAFVPDTLPGRAAGEGYGLSVRVVTNPVARNTFLSRGQLRMERRLRHAFLDRPEREGRRHLDDADREPGDPSRLRERRDAVDSRARRRGPRSNELNRQEELEPQDHKDHQGPSGRRSSLWALCPCGCFLVTGSFKHAEGL